MRAGWYSANRGESLIPTGFVGQKEANGFGLYDMHGNVHEWCADRYDAFYYFAQFTQGMSYDPRGPEKGESRVLRGGACLSAPDDCRAASRFRDTGMVGFSGFRLMFDLP